MAQNDTQVSMTFKNKVTNLDKLKEYEALLKGIKSSADNIPKNVSFGSNSNVEKNRKSIVSFNSSTKSLNNTLKQTSSLMNKAFSAGSLMAFFKAGQRLYSGLQKNINASASYVENLNLMQVAFKETGEANDRFNESFVNGLADAFGLDESTMTRQLGFYRQIGNALNVDSKYADMLSRNLLKMQLDMSSLYNLSFKKSGEVLQASIAGQTKPIRGATGADITQASLQTTLTDLGIDRAVSDLSRGEKVLTIYLSLVNQLSESQGDLAKTINSVANQEKILTEQSSRLSRNIGNVFSVSVGKALPYLNAFLMVINELVEKFAILVGFELPTYEQNGGYDLSDYLDDVADSADEASKKLSGLRSFDKLNVITTPKDTSGSALSGGIDQRLLDALEEYDLKMSSMENKATQIRDRIMEWLGFTKEVNTETGEITWKYDTIGKSAEQIAKEVGTNLGSALTKETSNLKWEEYGAYLAKGINTSLNFVNSFVDTYNWKELGSGFARGINKAIEDTDWNSVGKLFTSKLKITISTASGFLTTLDYEEVGKSIANFINGAIENVPTSDLVKGVNALAKGILTALKTAIKELDWGEIGSTVTEVLGGLSWETYLLLGFGGLAKITPKLASKLFNGDDLISSLFGTSKVSEVAKKTSKSFKIPDTKTITTGMKDLAIIVGGLTALVTAVGAFSKIPYVKGFISSGVDTLTKVFKGLGTIAIPLTYVSVLTGVMGKFPVSQFAKGLADLAIIIGGTTAIVGIIGVIDSIPYVDGFINTGIDTITKIFLGLSDIAGPLLGLTVFVGAMGAIMTATGGIGFAALALGLLGIAEVIAGFQVVLLAVGAIQEAIGAENIERGIEALVQVGIGIGRFAGSIVEGFSEEIFKSLDSLGTHLSTFMINAQSFFDGLTNIDESTANATKTLAEAILYITASNVLDGIFYFVTGGNSLSKFGKELVSFAPNFKKYADTVKGIDGEVVEASANAALSLTKFAKEAPSYGGIKSALLGQNLLSLFGLELVAFGKSFKTYYNDIKDVKGEVVEASANAAISLTKFANEVPSYGGLKSIITGQKLLSLFGAELALFGPLFNSYYKSVKGIDGSIVETSANAAKSLTEFAKEVPNQGGLASLFTGDNSLSKFGDELKKFGSKFKDYYDKVKDINTSKVNTVTDSLLSLINGLKTIKDNGLINTLKDFANQLSSSSNGIKSAFSTTEANSIGKSFGTKLGTSMSSAFKNNFSAKISIKDGNTSLKNLKISAYAGGGLPPVGNLFYAGEKGPELVANMGGKTVVANEKEVMNLFNNKFENKSSQPINLTIINKVDDDELSRRTISNLQDMASANGKPITIG